MGIVFFHTASCCLRELLIRSFMVYPVCEVHFSQQLDKVIFWCVHGILSGGFGASNHMNLEATHRFSSSVETRKEPLFQSNITLDPNSEVKIPL